CSGGLSGSLGKSHTPTLDERLQMSGSRLLTCRQRTVFQTVFVVAAKVFPGETGGGQIPGVPISRRSTPIDAEHGASSLCRAGRRCPNKDHSRRQATGVALVAR